MGSTLETNFFCINFTLNERGTMGTLSIKQDEKLIPAISKIMLKCQNQKMTLVEVETKNKTRDSTEVILIYANNLRFLLTAYQNSPYFYLEDISEYTTEPPAYKLEITLNFRGNNEYNYINLSGNRYRSVLEPISLKLKVPPTGAFSQVWTIHSEELYCGIIGLNQPEIRHFKANFDKKRVILGQKMDSHKNCKFCVIAGTGDYYTPIKTKLTDIYPIEPLPIRYKEHLLQESKLHYNTLYDNFLFQSESGKIPSSFIFVNKDKTGEKHYDKVLCATIGNCFSVGYITGPMALLKWTKNEKISDVLSKEFIPPILKDAQIHSGPNKGAYLDTFNDKLQYWTTGRIQLPKKGFTNWFPIKRDKEGAKVTWLAPVWEYEFRHGFRAFLSNQFQALKDGYKNFPGFFKKFDHLVVSPPYSGQIAYNLFQVLTESIKHDQLLGKETEEQLFNSIKSTVDWLLEIQREDGLWNQELKEDGEIFWDQTTLACIYPATLLFWWGAHYTDVNVQNAGLKAIQACDKLMQSGEYYGVYFETDAANHQGDLVTAIACIKCLCRIYELTRQEKWLKQARNAAWHMLSYMWGTGVQDTKQKVVTGGLPVTTYKSMGFPVIGGSELCQAIEGLLELAEWDRSFIKYAEAGMGYHSEYMQFQNKDDRGTYEIMWGGLDNWSTTQTPDLASYATGPFIRSLYLYSKLLKE
ncbi:MAG: hypothetical protein ACTSRE_02295 [Promethearchaeota archaeon]